MVNFESELGQKSDNSFTPFINKGDIAGFKTNSDNVLKIETSIGRVEITVDPSDGTKLIATSVNDRSKQYSALLPTDVSGVGKNIEFTKIS